MKRQFVIVLLAGVSVLSGCGSSSPPAGQPLAQEACNASGAQAAAYAAQAATANPKYVALSSDETALAASESQEEGELSDGTSSDDSGLGALAGADSEGSGPDLTVITECVSLGLSVPH